jgi:hypothetical protein
MRGRSSDAGSAGRAGWSSDREPGPVNVTRNAAITRVNTGDGCGIGVTDPAGFHPNANLPGSRFEDGAFHHAKMTRCGDLHCFVGTFHL